MNPTDAGLPDLKTKGMLARLLSTENISVMWGEFDTASFDVDSRVLRMPLFKDTLSKEEADMLIGHEVGHALFTDMADVSAVRELGVNFSYYNILEDVRIEKLIQRKFPGLAPTFRHAYESFFNKDLFRIRGDDLSTYNLADRINIRAKIGAHVDVPFSPEEELFYASVVRAETAQEVIDNVRILAEMIKSGKSEKTPESKNLIDSEDQEEGDFESVSNSSSESADSTEPSSEENESSESKQVEGPAGTESPETPKNDGAPVQSDVRPENPTLSPEEVCRTDVNLIENNAAKKLGFHVVYGPTSAQVAESIYSYAQLKSARKERLASRGDVFPASLIPSRTRLFDDCRREAQTMISEFNCKRAAHNYQRSEISKTGRIETNFLHKYKISDDIFRSVSIEPNQTNHGVVIFMDHSGSMDGLTPEVIRQIVVFVMFCKGVDIPFEVYLFTSDMSPNITKRTCLDDNVPEGTMRMSAGQVTQLITSELKSSEFNEALNGLYNIFCGYTASVYESYASTPLLEAVIIARKIVIDFKKKYGVENMNTIFLTDGDGHGLGFNKSYGYKKMVLMMADGTQINLKSHSFKESYGEFIQYLKSAGTKVLGIFLVSSRVERSDAYIHNMSFQMREEINVSLRSVGFYEYKGIFNYDNYFFAKIQSERVQTDLGDLSNESVNSIARDLISRGKTLTKKKALLRLMAKTIAI